MTCDKCGADSPKLKCVHCGHSITKTYLVHSGRQVFKVRCTKVEWRNHFVKFSHNGEWIGTFDNPKGVVLVDHVVTDREGSE